MYRSNLEIYQADSHEFFFVCSDACEDLPARVAGAESMVGTCNVPSASKLYFGDFHNFAPTDDPTTSFLSMNLKLSSTM